MSNSGLKWIFPASILVIPLLSSILIHPIQAQSGTGTIAGTVQDETGGTVPGVEISVRNAVTNIKRSTVSNDSGFFRLLSLRPGIYEVRAELAGFKTLVNSPVELTVGEVVSLNFVLEIGGTNEIVTVSDQKIAVGSEDSQISSLVDHRRVRDLPLNGRNVYVLATLQSGVVPAMMSVIQSGGPNSESFVTAGTRFRGNQFTIDGGHNTNDG
ncbi:MAG: carboxypeptidase-like regulatory domain-containing protein, partial [Acidobacteriota bacterium]